MQLSPQKLSQHEGSSPQSVTRQASQASCSGAPALHRPWGQPQLLQSSLHVLQLSPGLQKPSPHVGAEQQSFAQDEQLSPPLHTPSPQAPGQQSPAQPSQVSPGSQTPLPQAGSGQQSTGQFWQVSPPRQSPSPQKPWGAQSNEQLCWFSPPVHMPSPQWPAPQSSAQCSEFSPQPGSQMPSPQSQPPQTPQAGSPQSCVQVQGDSSPLHSPSPQTGAAQSAGHFSKFSPQPKSQIPLPQTILPHWPHLGAPQSLAQSQLDSLFSQTPLPQKLGDPQSFGQLAAVSSGAHTPSPQ